MLADYVSNDISEIVQDAVTMQSTFKPYRLVTTVTLYGYCTISVFIYL